MPEAGMEYQFTETLLDLLLQKLESLKSKVQLHNTISSSLIKEIDAFKLDFNNYFQSIGVESRENDSTNSFIDVLKQTSESTRISSDAMRSLIDVLKRSLDVISRGGGAMRSPVESINRSIGVKNPSNGSLNIANGSTKISGDAANRKGKLAKLIIKSASEKLKLSFYFDNIPARLAAILLAMNESKKLRVSEMQKLEGVSRNSVTRDLAILKKLGWIKFNGGRSNGYFSLTDEGVKAINESDL
jgi:hypothetical protein